MAEKLRVGIVGATGMVGQRFITLLQDHPYFEITALVASPRSAGKTYEEALGGRWKLTAPMPESVKNMIVMDSSKIDEIRPLVDFVFCAVDMKKDEIKALEEAYAKAEIPVVSNNSANRWTPDVPMVVPELNPEHIKVIEFQRKRLGTKKGFIAVKPNCSIQSYVPALTPLLKWKPTQVVATTYQAISGAGKTFREWPEMIDNVIPYIGGEEEKSEQEPMKIWGHRERRDCQGRRAAHHHPVHPRSGHRRSHRRGICKIREQADQRGNSRGMGELLRTSAGARSPARPEAVHPLLRGAGQTSDEARPRPRGRHGDLSRKTQRRHTVRLQVCRSLAQHAERSCRRRG